MTSTTEQLECLDSWGEPGNCSGAVEYRMALSGTGRSYPRCDRHWRQRLLKHAMIEQRYPHHQPADFDPLYAGEHWDEDY